MSLMIWITNTGVQLLRPSLETVQMECHDSCRYGGQMAVRSVLASWPNIVRHVQI